MVPSTMNRRDFIKAVIAIPVIAALPSPLKAAEELLEGITYVKQNFIDGEGVAVCETWYRSDGRVFRCIATETTIEITEQPYHPFVVLPQLNFPFKGATLFS